MKHLKRLLVIGVLAFVALLTHSRIVTKDSNAASAKPQDSAVTLIPKAKVDAAFAKGMPLLENSEFKVHASRRDGPGIAELHHRDTDIFYFLEGSATFVTGGETIEPKTVAPNEIRGKEVKGGEVHHVSKGDIIVVPKGVPHQFKEVNGPLLYYVVKVTSTGSTPK